MSQEYKTRSKAKCSLRTISDYGASCYIASYDGRYHFFVTCQKVRGEFGRLRRRVTIEVASRDVTEECVLQLHFSRLASNDLEKCRLPRNLKNVVSALKAMIKSHFKCRAVEVYHTPLMYFDFHISIAYCFSRYGGIGSIDYNVSTNSNTPFRAAVDYWRMEAYAS